jgi:hypothetical protein
VWQGEPVVIVARIAMATTGDPIVSGNVTSVSVSVFDMTASAQADVAYSSGAIDPTTVYYDTLQYDAENLLGDSLGYNFKYILDADDYAMLGGKRYRMQIVSAIGSSSHLQVYDVKVGAIL